MDSKKNSKITNKCSGGGDFYREKIIEMINQIDDEKFLNQIRIILKRHIEKRGG